MLFKIASGISTPLALSGIIIIVLFIVYKIILKKEIFPKLTKIHSFNIINKIINYLFILAVLALVLGVAAYIIIQIVPTNNKNNEIVNELSPSVKLIPSDTLIVENPPPEFPYQGEKQNLSSTSKNEKFSVIHFVVIEEELFPIIKVTLKNDTNRTQVITNLKVVIHEYEPYIASPVSVKLEPLVVWDIELPYNEGIHHYKPTDPILISSDDAASIKLRLFQADENGPIPPHKYGYFILKFIFVSDSGIEAETRFFILWNNKVLTK